jgi:hypothetical protein
MTERKKIDYPEAYRGLLKFSDFSEALASLTALEAHRRNALSAGDKKALRDIKKVAEAGERRSRGIAGNPRVQAALKREKGEIALWFHVWRENPPVFFTWLRLRLASAAFLETFGEEKAARVRAQLPDPDAATPDPAGTA